MTGIRPETRAMANVVKQLKLTGLTHGEIAKVLDIKPGRAKKLIAKATYRGPEWPKTVARVWRTGSAIVRTE